RTSCSRLANDEVTTLIRYRPAARPEIAAVSDAGEELCGERYCTESRLTLCILRSGRFVAELSKDPLDPSAGPTNPVPVSTSVAAWQTEGPTRSTRGRFEAAMTRGENNVAEATIPALRPPVTPPLTRTS